VSACSAGDTFVPGSLLDDQIEQVLGDGRVAARGGVGQVADQGEMQWVGAGGQCLVKYPVAADAFEVNVLVQQVPFRYSGLTGPVRICACSPGTGT
jgi:hypothetical protein